MFGSNFDANFSIPQFPFEGTDPNGGLFGANFSPDLGGSMEAGGLGAVAPPAVPPGPLSGGGSIPGATPVAPHPTLSPLGGGPLAPGAGTPNQAAAPPEASPSAPAAGIGGQFGPGKL